MGLDGGGSQTWCATQNPDTFFLPDTSGLRVVYVLGGGSNTGRGGGYLIQAKYKSQVFSSTLREKGSDIRGGGNDTSPGGG